MDKLQRRNKIDYAKYGAKLDPEENRIFFGPITLKELKRSIEVEEKIIKMRQKQKNLENKENKDEDALDRTFEIADDAEEKTVREDRLKDVTQLHTDVDETKLIELSFVKPSKSVASSKNNQKCLLDATLHLNESMKPLLQTPLIEKMSKTNIVVGKNERTPSKGTPSKKEKKKIDQDSTRFVKLSDTFITDMEYNVLINTTISDEMNAESENIKPSLTPDIFKQKKNDIWKDTDSTDLRRSAFKSKLPKKKTPMKNKAQLFAKSPVAEYIRRGVGVQSMSKARHSHCVRESQEIRSKSDNKNPQQCKIPVPTSTTVKRKLNLGETGLRKPLFKNPDN